MTPHDNKADVTGPHPMLSATHFCRDCRALWRQCDDFTFNLRSAKCCDKCDNPPVAEQLLPLIPGPDYFRLMDEREIMRKDCERAWNEVDEIAKHRDALGVALNKLDAEVVALRKVAQAFKELHDNAEEVECENGLGLWAQHGWWEAVDETLDELDRPCTCHPDDNPPQPCPQKYALSECKKAASVKEVIDRLEGSSLQPSGDTPAQLAEYLASGARLVETFHQLPGVARAMREAAALLRELGGMR